MYTYIYIFIYITWIVYTHKYCIYFVVYIYIFTTRIHPLLQHCYNITSGETGIYLKHTANPRKSAMILSTYESEATSPFQVSPNNFRTGGPSAEVTPMVVKSKGIPLGNYSNLAKYKGFAWVIFQISWILIWLGRIAALAMLLHQNHHTQSSTVRDEKVNFPMFFATLSSPQKTTHKPTAGCRCLAGCRDDFQEMFYSSWDLWGNDSQIGTIWGIIFIIWLIQPPYNYYLFTYSL